uniref:Uncharacterized protein n=1 Tax=Brevibacterium sp. Ap13 TaxID=1406197 RepID=U5NZJ4_9MICO|nr:hypothetical protein AP13_p00260 [Brevibacterium sp. Ap13]
MEQSIRDVEISDVDPPSKGAGGASESAASLECAGMSRDSN